MLKDRFRYSVELYKNDGTLLGQVAVSPDWEPAFEWTCFEGIRSARLDPAVPTHHGCVEPVWHSEKGPPYVGGFRVVIGGESSEPVCEEFPQSYFRKLAQKAAGKFIESGQLADGDVFQFLTTAFPRQEIETPSLRRRIVVEDEDIREPWTIVPGCLPRSTSSGGAAGNGPVSVSADLPVFIPQSLLDDMAGLSRAAATVETGGVLIGHLCRDKTAGQIFVDVTGHIPARKTIAEVAKLTFTAETWTHARLVIALRRRSEVMLGWWHSHVGREFCKDCPAERQRECKFSKGFFSSHDQHFHRTAFSRAYHIGLVVNDPAAGELSFALFGWRRGSIEVRDFHVTGLADIPLGTEESGAIAEGELHAANIETR